MSDIKVAYGTSTGITCTLASLASTPGTAREGTAVDNTSNKFQDAMVYLAARLVTGTPGSDKVINIWAYGSEDATNYTDNATGTDAAVTLRAPNNFRLIGIIGTPDSGGLTYKSNPMPVASAFGGILPRKWGIVVENRTNLAFETGEGNQIKTYTGVYNTVG